jgi:hypothetical protein
MSRSLNPNATPPVKPVAVMEAELPPRRNVLAAVAATIIGTFVGIVPLAADWPRFSIRCCAARKRAAKAGRGSRFAWRRSLPFRPMGRRFKFP